MDSESSEPSSASEFKRPDAPRPLSRRGYREYNNSAVSGSESMSTTRPTSAYRVGTASRVSTAGFGPPPPTAGRLSTGMTGLSMADRPMTQHGLSGLRTGTSRGFRTRQLQDKRYWEELMQVKIRDMKAEIARLNEKADAGEREKSAKKHYEKRVKELAQELTDLQGRLADYNTALRIINGETTKQYIEEHTREIEKTNKKLEEDIEQVFLEKQRKEMQLAQLKEQLNKEQSTISRITAEMSLEQRAEFQELEATASALRDEVEQARSQIDHLTKEKDEFSKEISGSQIKVQLLELNRRLVQAEEKRDSLRNELSNRLAPHEEREKLLQQVKEDNAAISSLDNNASTMKEQIKKVQDLIEQAEQDLEEGNSERHLKYRELKKREETMENFLVNFDENVKKEKEKIEQLEKDIVFSLEHSSSNIDVDLNEIDSLKSRGPTDRTKSLEELTKDYQMFQANLKKAEATREKLQMELVTLPEKTQEMKNELVTLSNLEKLRDEGSEKKKQLEDELEELKNKIEPAEKAVRDATEKLKRIQSSLDGNEMYARLNKMEEQIDQLESRKSMLEEDISSITLKTDYEPIKKEVMKHIEMLNGKIIDDLNTVKAY